MAAIIPTFTTTASVGATLALAFPSVSDHSQTALSPSDMATPTEAVVVIVDADGHQEEIITLIQPSISSSDAAFAPTTLPSPHGWGAWTPAQRGGVLAAATGMTILLFEMTAVVVYYGRSWAMQERGWRAQREREMLMQDFWTEEDVRWEDKVRREGACLTVEEFHEAVERAAKVSPSYQGR
jgi:hypothetical protein